MLFLQLEQLQGTEQGDLGAAAALDRVSARGDAPQGALEALVLQGGTELVAAGQGGQVPPVVRGCLGGDEDAGHVLSPTGRDGKD